MYWNEINVTFQDIEWMAEIFDNLLYNDTVCRKVGDSFFKIL